MKHTALSLALVATCTTLALPAFAQDTEEIPFEGRRALMRQCTQTHENDIDLPIAGIGAFCTCYVDELLIDSEQRPEIYFDEGPKKPYYSAKEEDEKASARANAFASHVSYCKTVLD